MFLEFPWALTALVALPIAVVIYLLRNRSKKQVVSALFLWSSPNLSANQGQRIQKVHSNWLLFLELLVLTLLILAATDVHVRWFPQDAPTVLILDDSWSMQTSEKQAIDAIHKWVSQKRIIFPVQIVRVGKTAIRDGEPCNYLVDLTDRLVQWQSNGMKAPECSDSVLKDAIERFCSPGKPAHAVIVTDHPRPGLAQDGRVTVLSVGTPDSNLAFTSAVRFPSAVDGQDVVIVEIANLSTQTQTPNCQLQIESESSRPLDSSSIPSGKNVEIKTSVPSDKTVSLELSADALAIDNRVVLPPLPSQTIHVRLDVSNPILAPAVKKAVELAQDGQRKIELVSSNEDLLVTDNPDSDSTYNVNRLQFDVPSEPLDKIEPTVYKGPYIANSSSSLMTGTDFSGVLWGVENNDWRMENAESALLSVGGAPLIVHHAASNGVNVTRLRIVPELSNLTQSPNFPIFIYNVLKQQAESLPGLQSSAISAEDFFVFHSRKESEPLKVISPNGKTDAVPFRLGQAVFQPYDIGEYKIVSEKQTYQTSVNALNRNESDLRSLKSGEWGKPFSAQQKESQFVSLRVPLLLLALALAVVHQLLTRRNS